MALGFYGVLCWVGWQWVEFGESQTSPVLEMPLTFVNAAMIVGGVLMILNTFVLLLEARLSGKDIRHASTDDELELALAQIESVAMREKQ
jgi:TRAP-type C4-dicarboxylate transport system permease small subunit